MARCTSPVRIPERFWPPWVPGQVVTGLRFRPGAAPGVLGVSAWALRDQRLHLEDLWPGATVSQRIAEMHDPAAGLTAAVASRLAEPDLALSVVLSRLHTGFSVAATADAGVDRAHAAPAVPRRVRLRPGGAAPHPPVPPGAAGR
ncbi:MAG: hypothetical protein M3332_04965 [Actinomycetota bacterium]|nr:hypothetical protein [Actinomycetota bacterium]